MNAPMRTLGELPTEQDPRWGAVVARDRSADGSFYYSVSTTGVYCRPSCPARHAKPSHAVRGIPLHLRYLGDRNNVLGHLLREGR